MKFAELQVFKRAANRSTILMATFQSYLSDIWSDWLRSSPVYTYYPINLINSSINKFLHNIDNIEAPKNESDDTPFFVIPILFKDQQSANSVKIHMQNLSANIGVHTTNLF